METIAVVLGRGKAQSIFRFVEAVGAGDTTVALRQLGRLLDEGEPPLRILALVDRLTGQLRVAKELEGSRRGESLASLLRVPPFVARNLAASARRLDREGLSQAVAAVSKTDRLLKSSRLSPRVLLESLTIFLCSLGEKKRARAGTARLHFPASEARRRPSRDL